MITVSRLKRILKYLLAVFFALAGLNHFINPAFYRKIMPPYLPWHLALVYVSGILEISLGTLLLTPRFTHIAAWGLIGLLIAVFPANIHMAVHPEIFPEYGALLLWLRLPVQFLLIAWCYIYRSPVVRTKRLSA